MHSNYLDIPASTTESVSPPIGNSPDAHASAAAAAAAANAASAAAAAAAAAAHSGQAAHLRLSPLPHHLHAQLGSQSSDSVDLPPRTVVSFKIFFSLREHEATY